MKVLITGTSNGIGKAIAEKFLIHQHDVTGFDICDSTIDEEKYTHVQTDIYEGWLPDIDGLDILINNAGMQGSEEDIDINLRGTMRITEKYGVHEGIKSVLFIASASARTGAEFPEYAASKGGMVAYMKNVALRIAKFGATSNSLSPGGVLTPINDHIIRSEEMWGKVMAETMLNKWASCSEIAEWAYFVTVTNKSMTAQDILIDNGENAKANFIW